MPRFSKKPELPPEIFEICKLANKNCPICSLPIEKLKEFQKRRFEEKHTYPQLREFLKKECGISPNYTVMGRHVKIHAMEGSADQLLAKHEDKAVVRALQDMHPGTRYLSGGQVDKAYYHLTSLAADFVKRITNITDTLLRSLENKLKIEEELKDLPVLKAAEILAKLHKDASQMISTIQALRAPKVMVQQFLEQAVNETIFTTGEIFSKICFELREAIIDSYKNNDELSDGAITRILQKSAIGFKEEMLDMKRRQMKNAIEILADLEKII